MATGSHQEVEVAIIGAGWYGLVAARTYLRLRPSVNLLIIDSDSSVGGVWSKERLYPNLVAQVRLGLFNYSDSPMYPNGGDPNDPKVTGEMIHNYLQKYAEDHDLLRRIRFNTFVVKAERSARGWHLVLKDSTDVIETAKLLVCTGVTSIPNMPTFKASGDAETAIPVIHSRDLGRAYEDISRSSVQNVVVVGAAKSAYDAVYLLLSMGKQVTWLIRTEGAGPLAILPFKVMGIMNTIAVASTRLMTYLSPSILKTKGSLYWLLQRTIPGRWCVGKFWDFLDYLSSSHAGYSAGDHVAMLKPEIDRQSVFWANSGLGVVTLPDFWKTLHSPRLKVARDRIVGIKGKTACLQSNNMLSPDYIVACTGWGDHFAMFDAKTKVELGLPLYDETCSTINVSDGIDWDTYDLIADREVDEKLPFLAASPTIGHMETLRAERQKHWRLYRRVIPVSQAQKDDRSVVILGQIHTVQTPLVSEIQTFWSILYLLREIDVPDTDTMAKEIALWNAWTRKRYLNQGQKFPYSLYEFLPYVDTLFSDMGLNSRRKSNGLSELFSPYRAEDFGGFIDEYMAKSSDQPMSDASSEG